MSDLPRGWGECAIGEVCGIVGGGTPPSKDPANFSVSGGVSWITPADLSGYKEKYISRGARNLTPTGLARSSAKVMPPGTVLFSSRAPVGYVAIAANEMATNQGFKSFLVPKGFDSGYLYYYLKYIKPLAEARATGTTFKELSGSAAAKLPLAVAPSSEQVRIATKLDAVLARVDGCRERLDRVPAILRKFREAVLEAAVSGRLTEEWRETHGETEWSTLSVEALCTDLFDGPFGSHLKSADYSDSGVRVVRLENIGHLRFLGERKTYIPRKKYRSLLKHLLKPRDVVFSSFVDEEVRVCLIPDNLGTAINKADCFCLRVNSTKALPSFVAYRLAATKTYQDMSELVHGATRPRVNLSQLRAYDVSLPPMNEQREIARRTDELFALADGLEAKYRAAVERVERLTPAVLAKAFRGELVPQDPEDEPAERLLERIRVQRASEVRSGSAGRGPGRRAKSGGHGPAAAKAGGGAGKKRGRRSRASPA